MSSSFPSPSGAAGAAGAVAGGLAGFFPQKGNQITQSNQQGGSQQSGSSNVFNQGDIQNYINNLIRSSTTGTTGTTAAGTTTPNISPQAQALINQLTQKYMTLQPPSMTGYGAQQTANINAGANAQEQAVNNIMASRGLGTSPVAATAQAGVEQNRVNQITGMQQQLPILQQQMNLQNLAQAGNFAASIPYGQTTGQTTTGTTSQDSTQNTTGTSEQQSTNNTQSNFQNTLLNWLNQYSRTDTSQGGGIGGGLSGAISTALMAAMLFSDEKLKKNIESIHDGMSVIRKVEPRKWDWKGGSVHSVGVVAQELEKVLPSLIVEDKSYGVPLKKVDYIGLIPYLVSAVKNLDMRTQE
jgi:hypothetical protein